MKLIWWKLKMSYHILSILVGMVQLLSAICFCLSSYVQQQLHSLGCQTFVHYNSLVFFLPISGPLIVQGFIFEGDLQFTNFFKKKICEVHWKTFHPYYPPSISSLYWSPKPNLKEALPMPRRMFSITHLSASLSLVYSFCLIFACFSRLPPPTQFGHGNPFLMFLCMACLLQVSRS